MPSMYILLGRSGGRVGNAVSVQCEGLSFKHASDMCIYQWMSFRREEKYEREESISGHSLQVTYTLFSQHDCERDYI